MFNFLKNSYASLKNALTKSKALLSNKIKALFGRPLQDATFEELEQIFYEADLGTLAAGDFAKHVRFFLKKHPNATSEEIMHELKTYALDLLTSTPSAIPPVAAPLVMLIVGVNGSGKTTSLAKLAHLFKEEGKNVLLVAADTFRAAATDQLELWAKRLNVDIVTAKQGSDPSAVVFDGITAAKARGSDIVLIDTAGRLHNKKDLMQELEKIKRVCKKVIPDAPHETLLVVDATTGQNALTQASTFHACTPLTGIILTKLDGSAKGGVVFSIYKELHIPVRFVGIGEKAEDFVPFDPKSYTQALFD